MSDLEEMDTAIAGLEEMTAQLERLHEQRAIYVRTFGWKKARADFAELDGALRRLRRAAK